MSEEPRCDLSRLLDPEVWAKISDAEKLSVLRWCGCLLWPMPDGWVARFKRGDRISAPDRERLLEQTRAFLKVSPDLWPLGEAS